MNRDYVECSAPVDKHVEYSTPCLNVTNNSNANTDSSIINSSNANTVSNDTNNSNANTDLNNIINSNANTKLFNISDTYATWCHTGGLLRSDVGFRRAKYRKNPKSFVKKCGNLGESIKNLGGTF